MSTADSKRRAVNSSCSSAGSQTVILTHSITRTHILTDNVLFTQLLVFQIDAELFHNGSMITFLELMQMYCK